MHQRHFIRFLSCGPGDPRSFRVGERQHPPEHAIFPEHATGQRSRDLRNSRPYRYALDPLTRGLADHSRLPAIWDAIVVCCGREGPESGQYGAARCPVASTGALAARQRGRGTHARRVTLVE